MKIMTLICMVFIFSSCSNLEKSLKKAIAYGSIQELNNINPKVEKNLLVRLYESPIYSENCFKETHGICHYRYFLSVSTFDEYPEVNIYNINQVGEISEIKWLNKQSSDYAEIKFTFNKYTKAALNNNSSLKNKIEDILVKLTPIKYIEEKYSANNSYSGQSRAKTLAAYTENSRLFSLNNGGYMIEPTQILWTPAGKSMPSLGSKSLVDVSDGDTPNIRMPIRMLSIDTPEVTAKSTTGAANVDDKFNQLADWIKDGIAPISEGFRDYILLKLENIDAGTLQFTQGKEASAYYKQKIDERLSRPGSNKQRNLFIRSTDFPFDSYGRLLAYVAPSYSKKEREKMTRRERATFNFDMIESGWAAPFIIFPNIPGELDLPLFLEVAVSAKEERKGQYQNDQSLPGYEYRMCEKLYGITKRMVEGVSLSYPEQLGWRTRYCADMRNRQLLGPENYFSIPEPYRIWIWPEDVQRSISMLNFVPA